MDIWKQSPKVRLVFHPPFQNSQTSDVCWFQKVFISGAEPHLQVISVIVIVESGQKKKDQSQHPVTISASLLPGQGVFKICVSFVINFKLI